MVRTESKVADRSGNTTIPGRTPGRYVIPIRTPRSMAEESWAERRVGGMAARIASAIRTAPPAHPPSRLAVYEPVELELLAEPHEPVVFRHGRPLVLYYVLKSGENGYFTIQDKPGLGIELNPDVARAHLAPGETWWG